MKSLLFKFPLLALIFIFSAHLRSHAQNYFQKTYPGSGSDWARSIYAMDNGTYIISGWTQAGPGFNDACLLNIDLQGNVIWSKHYGGNDQEGCRDVMQTSDGGLMMGAHSSSYGSSTDNYLIRTDANGDTLWTHLYTSGANDLIEEIIETSDGGFVGVGYQYNHAMLLKVNALGDTVFNKVYHCGLTSNGLDVIETSDGRLALTGNMQVPGSSNTDLIFLKLNSNGDTLFHHRYGGGQQELGQKIIEMNNGDFVIAGNTRSFGEGSDDFYLIRINAQGDTVWTRAYGGSDQDFLTSMSPTPDEGFIMAGYTESEEFVSGNFGGREALIIKTNSLGHMEWARSYRSGYPTVTDVLYDILPTPGGGYIATGYADPQGSDDIYVIRMGPDGYVPCGDMTVSPIESSTTTSINPLNISQISTDDQSPYYAVGGMGNGPFQDTAVTVVCDSCLLPQTGFTYTENGLTITFSDTSSGAEDYYWDFDDGDTDTTANPTHTYATGGFYDACLITENECGTDTACTEITLPVNSIHDLNGQTLLTVKPNPFDRNVSFSPSEAALMEQDLWLQVYSVTGQLIYRKQLAASLNVNTANWQNGMYFFEVSNSHELLQTGKIIKSGD